MVKKSFSVSIGISGPSKEDDAELSIKTTEDKETVIVQFEGAKIPISLKDLEDGLLAILKYLVGEKNESANL